MEIRRSVFSECIAYISFFFLLSVILQARAIVLDDSCTVNILNRTVPVRPDGGWSMPNVPSFMGQVRARVTCTRDGQTISGQTDFFTVVRDGVTRTGSFEFETPDPAPSALAFDPSGVTFLNAIGATADLGVVATFPDGSTRSVTEASSGINYNSSNPAIVAVDEDGAVSAAAAGSALITARLDGAVAVKQVTVSTAGDSDNDGLPDDYEELHGLNPNDPIDAHEDQDDDGLTALEEFRDWGTDPTNADSDGDGIEDGEEVEAGDDGFMTDPLNTDTDGDGLWDALEIQVGSSPVDPTDRNLAAALSLLEITPSTATIRFNTVETEASRQLTVTGHLIDGNEIDLTATSDGTSYASSDLAVCSFGAQSGRVFAGTDGTCTVTATNSGFSAEATIVVQTFSPTALSFVDIPGYAHNVDVQGGYAYVAAGSAGLQVVDVADRSTPSVVASQDTPGDAQDVRIAGDLAFVADGSAGLQILDIADPLQPEIIGAIDTPGTAQDVFVKDNLAYVADSAGLQIIDIASPTSPSIVGTVNTPGTAYGVAVSEDGLLAVVADGTVGIQVIDTSAPANPSIMGGVDTGDARDVVTEGDYVFVADLSSSLTSVDITTPSSPIIAASTPRNNGGLLVDVALLDGFTFGADIFFVNGVPIVDVTVPEVPAPRAILDFGQFRDDNGTGIAVDNEYVYLTAAVGSSTRLYIGQYRAIEDTEGIAPTVQITSPAPDETLIEGAILQVTAEATDDIAVAAVNFEVNGELESSDTGEPYETSLIVPTGAFGLTLGAHAIDFGGNVGYAEDVVVNVIPDPLTTAVGTVIDTDGNSVAGATVDCLEVTDLTDAGGAFSIPDLPTIQAVIQCEAIFATASGETLRGRSTGVPPVPSGTTNVGDIIIGAGGKIVVANDEWTLSNTGFARSPDAAIYALNVASFFTDGALGNFLAFSTNFGLTQSELAATIRGAGHTWEVSTTVDFSLPSLLEYDAIFLAGDPVDTTVLIDYVNNGGNVYLAGGVTSSPVEADRWNPFLNAFGMSFASPVNGIGGNIDVSSATHPIFDGVARLYQVNGRSITGAGIEFSLNGEGLYAVVDVVTSP